jgi:predicted dehydrogenase
MIRIRVELSPERKDLYMEALSRLRGVELTDGPDAGALISGEWSAVIDTGLPCLLDRPEGITLTQLKALASSSTSVMPAHIWRFFPSIRQVHHRHARGHLGEPGLLRIHHWRPERQPVRGLGFGEVDLALWLFGSMPVSRHSFTLTDYLQLHLGFPNDGMAVIDVASNRPGLDPYYSLHLIGSEGAAYADDHHNAHLLMDQRGTQALLQGRNERLAVVSMVEEFVSGLKEQRAWSVNLSDSVRANQIIEEVANA